MIRKSLRVHRMSFTIIQTGLHNCHDVRQSIYVDDLLYQFLIFMEINIYLLELTVQFISLNVYAMVKFVVILMYTEK